MNLFDKIKLIPDIFNFKIIKNNFDNLSFKKKLIILYLCCLIPLALTSFTILYLVLVNEVREIEKELDNAIIRIEHEFRSSFQEAIELTKNLRINKQLFGFINKQYNSADEFYQAYIEIVNNYKLSFGIRSDISNLMVYSSNNTIINSEIIKKIEQVQNEEWYRLYKNSGKDIYVAVYYDFTSKLLGLNNSGRNVSVISKMNYDKRYPYENFLKVDFNYKRLGELLTSNINNIDAYICTDNKIVFSNVNNQLATNEFEKFDKSVLEGRILNRDIEIYGREWNIFLVKSDNVITNMFKKNSQLLFFIILFCFACPFPILIYFYRSVVGRISKLSKHLDYIQADTFELIEYNGSKDEIGRLFYNYNKMSTRIQNLIQISYKEKIYRQELELSKQQAELQALHSQINPHFIFNALESIRMRSILKNENETADNIENLAILMRKSVNRDNDNITIQEEIKFVNAFLELQKYRFGEKLNYKVNVDDNCLNFEIPKLTIITFVENSCIHGIEDSQDGGWIFVNITKEDEKIIIEIEDTGKGIKDKNEIINKINNVNMETIRKSKSIGILNACMRLKLFTNNRAQFVIESELNSGTIITLEIPTD